MAEYDRVKLFSKLNTVAYRALDSATVFCKQRGNPYVEWVHWLSQIHQLQDSDFRRICNHFDVNDARLSSDITASLDRLPRGATSITNLSVHVDDAVQQGFLSGSVMFGEQRVRTGHLLIGMLKSRTLRDVCLDVSQELKKIDLDQLCEQFRVIVANSPETDALSQGAEPSSDASGGGSGAAPAAAVLGKQEALQRYSVDLTQNARDGQMDPIVGRDQEIRQIVDILMRRRQNNPILTGEAGVGKTAVVEGFAQRIASGDVPPSLRDVTLRALDIGLLQAGASMKGEFENRLRQVIDEVHASEKPVILFIDEAHTLIGAGGAAGTGDAANLLKPALARGTLRTIAATTWGEYKKHIEKDPALTRRFQVIQVQEPDEQQALLMMRSLASTLEKHHRVQVLDEALCASVHLSHRYIPARQLPDKAISLLDTACARVSVSQHAVPAALEDCRRRIEGLEIELEIIDRESAIGVDTGDRRQQAEQRLHEARDLKSELESRWQQEKEVVEQILRLRSGLLGVPPAIESDVAADAEADEGRAKSAPYSTVSDGAVDGGRTNDAASLEKLRALQQDLIVMQGETPLILPSVDEAAVASVVGDWTGIPVGRMVKNEIDAVLDIAKTVGKRVLGQDHALEMIGRRLQTSRAGLEDQRKPIGVFLLAGPSGVGKTETALALAEALYGGEQNLITINMSEFQESHTVSTLKGAPPGYVGYGEGGVLTEAVRRRPYSVILLDEVEKAHQDVHEIFYQVFDKGWMEDGEGRVIDFKNTLILLTSNVGGDLIAHICAAQGAAEASAADDEDGGGQRSEPADGASASVPPLDDVVEALRPALLQSFPAALLGRLVVVPYYALGAERIAEIARLQLDRVADRVLQRYGVAFTYDNAAIDLIASRCTALESGARMVESVISNHLLPRISQQVLQRIANDLAMESVHVSVVDGELHSEIGDASR